MNSKKIVLGFIGTKSLIPTVIFTLFPLTTVFGLIFLLCTTIPKLIRANKTIKLLENSGKLDLAAKELMSAESKKYINGRLILTESFLFAKGTGVACGYDEILWAYKSRHTTRAFLIPISVNDSLFIATKTKGPREVARMGKDKLDDIKNAIVEIYKHNQNCLVGYTNESLAKYKAISKNK